MLKLSLALALLFGVISAAQADHWAVLVAGSNGYWNYRHQADICHAYQILKKNGVPENQIIVMAYDDVANDPENPFPGQIFNKPNGQDVYAGCKIDYRGKDVNPKNFLSILQGDAKNVTGGNGRVLGSNENSRVFVNFADHGAPGLIAFPDEYLYAPDLHTALVNMHTTKMYKELVFYLEACESGSMFQDILEKDINIFAVTAANPSESSWGTYCPPDDVVNGQHINSCLGDLFSVNWMEDTERNNIQTESLFAQYSQVHNETTQSDVMKFGTETFTKEPIGNFQGDQDLAEVSIIDQILRSSAVQSVNDKRHLSAINARDAKLNHNYAVHAAQGDQISSIDLVTELNVRMRANGVMSKLAPQGGRLRANTENGHLVPKNYECLRALMTTYEATCGKMSDYELQFVKYLVQECEYNLASPTDFTSAIKKVRNACTH